MFGIGLRTNVINFCSMIKHCITSFQINNFLIAAARLHGLMVLAPAVEFESTHNCFRDSRATITLHRNGG